MVKKVTKKKVKKILLMVFVTFKPLSIILLLPLLDPSGNAISWASAGRLGFRGSKKSTPFAAQTASADAAKKAIEHGLKLMRRQGKRDQELVEKMPLGLL